MQRATKIGANKPPLKIPLNAKITSGKLLCERRAAAAFFMEKKSPLVANEVFPSSGL